MVSTIHGCSQNLYMFGTTVAVIQFDDLSRTTGMQSDLQLFQSRWHRPEDVLYMGVRINHLLGSVPSTLHLLYQGIQMCIFFCSNTFAQKIRASGLFCQIGQISWNSSEYWVWLGFINIIVWVFVDKMLIKFGFHMGMLLYGIVFLSIRRYIR